MQDNVQQKIDMTEEELASPLASYICLSFFFFSLAFLCFCLCACTNVVMTHTEGGSTETLDDAQTTSPNVSPTLNIP